MSPPQTWFIATLPIFVAVALAAWAAFFRGLKLTGFTSAKRVETSTPAGVAYIMLAVVLFILDMWFASGSYG